jgi:competence protein ComEC
VSRLPWGWLAAALLAGGIAWEAGRRLRSTVRWAAGAGAAGAVLIALPLVAVPGGDALEIHVLDVGQGDAVAIRTPAARWVVIDAGPRSDGWDAGVRRVLPFLRARGATRVEVLILTHPHADHIGGAPALLRGMEVGRLVEPGFAAGSRLYLETLETAEERGVPWSAARAGRTLRLDGVELRILLPEPQMLDAVADANEISAVTLLRFGHFGALFTGDAGEREEAHLVERHGGELRVQLLKAGHHGSRTSTSPGLLAAAEPELAVISAGRRNRYGHPAPEVVRRLERRGVAVARTDREGTVSIRARADGTWDRLRP